MVRIELKRKKTSEKKDHKRKDISDKREAKKKQDRSVFHPWESAKIEPAPPIKPPSKIRPPSKVKPPLPPISDQSLKYKRVPTYIHGFDELIEGGIPSGSLVLLTGSTGSGKTTFATDFLIKGALREEPGVYISLEEPAQYNVQQIRAFGWPIDRLIKEKKIIVVEPDLYKFDSLLTTIEDSIDRIKAKRIVIDAISILSLYFADPYRVRKSLIELAKLLKKTNCTTIAIDEVPEFEKRISSFGVEEFVSDGVIIMYYTKFGSYFLRALTVRKMRLTNHSTKIHPFEIKSPEGVIVYPHEEAFEI